MNRKRTIFDPMHRILAALPIVLPFVLNAQGAKEEYDRALADYTSGHLTTAMTHADSAIAKDPNMAAARFVAPSVRSSTHPSAASRPQPVPPM